MLKLRTQTKASKETRKEEDRFILYTIPIESSMKQRLTILFLIVHSIQASDANYEQDSVNPALFFHSQQVYQQPSDNLTTQEYMSRLESMLRGKKREAVELAQENHDLKARVSDLVKINNTLEAKIAFMNGKLIELARQARGCEPDANRFPIQKRSARAFRQEEPNTQRDRPEFNAQPNQKRPKTVGNRNTTIIQNTPAYFRFRRALARQRSHPR